MKKGIDSDIQEGLQEYHEHKNPVFDSERGYKVGGQTLFDLQSNLNREKLEDFEDNMPLDEEGNLWVERFFDRKTGKLKTDMFNIINTFPLKKTTYTIMYVSGSHAQFVVDFENRKCFPGLEKGAPRSVSSVDDFGEKEIVIYGGYDDVICLDNSGKQIGDTCVGIKKLKYGNIDILEFTSRVNEDCDGEDLRTKTSYLGSDDKRYQPKYKQINDVEVFSFEEISNTIKNPIVVDI